MSAAAEKTTATTMASSPSHRFQAYRSASPSGAARTVVLRPGATVRRKFSSEEERQHALMHKAIEVALCIERRMPSGGGSSGWPFPVHDPDDVQDDALRLAALERLSLMPTRAEISFMDDVADLLLSAHGHDQLGIKLVVGRATSPKLSWEHLRRFDPQYRKRMMLTILRWNALALLCRLDRELGKKVVDRVDISA